MIRHRLDFDIVREACGDGSSGIVSRRSLLGGALPLAAMVCGWGQRPDAARASDVTVRSGADILAASGFASLAGKSVGLVTNHTGRVGDERLVDVMARAPGLRLAAIFTPEHGLAGAVEAGANVAAGRDAATGRPVYSLYGATTRPTPRMLAGLDVLVFDMQDIGVRYYTYISTMGRAMQSAAAAKIPFLVLDRPNPLGGEDVVGFLLEPAHRSFVGLYAIPQVHGLTCGEIATLIRGERMLPGLAALKLDVVRMEGWQRSMRWPETHRQWVATSPNIPTFETALAYAGTGLFEATSASEGRGTSRPFLMLGHPALEASGAARELMDAALPGVVFAPATLTPAPIPGVATSPRFSGRTIPGISVAITDHRIYRPLDAGVLLLSVLDRHARRIDPRGIVDDRARFARLAGSDRLAGLLDKNAPLVEIAAAWRPDVEAFKAKRGRYLAY